MLSLMTEDKAAGRPAMVGLPKDAEDRLRELSSHLDDLSVIILPTEVRSGKAHYLPADTEARKVAKSVGLNAQFLYDAESRNYLHEYSADWVLTLAIAIGQDISVDLVTGLGQYILARARNAVRRGSYNGDEARVPLTITIQQVVHNERGGIELNGLFFEGEAQAVVDSISEVLAPIHRNIRTRELGPGDSST